MAMRGMALALAAGAVAVGGNEAPLFELVRVPAEYARQSAPAPAPTPAARRHRPAPPAIYAPPPMIAPPPPVYVQAPPAPPRPAPWPVVPPPPPRPPLTPLRAKNPQSWITNDDYPAAALRAGESGTVGFRLDVDDTGRVTGCTITASSGSALLDATSCSLMKRRASFWPARDQKGPIPASYYNRLRWEIPEEPTVPVTSWASILRFTIGADGQLSSCSYQGYGAPEIEERSPCVEVSELPAATMRKLRGRSKGPVTMFVRFDHEIAGMAMPRVPAPGPKFRRIAAWQGRYGIDLYGARVDCQGDIDDHELPMPAVTCRSYTSYDRQEAPRQATVTISFLTDGDSAVAAALPLLGAAGD